MLYKVVLLDGYNWKRILKVSRENFVIAQFFVKKVNTGSNFALYMDPWINSARAGPLIFQPGPAWPV